MSDTLDREYSNRILEQYNRDYYHRQVLDYYRRIVRIIGVTEAREWRKAAINPGDTLRMVADTIWRKWLSLRNIVIIRDSAANLAEYQETHPRPEYA